MNNLLEQNIIQIKEYCEVHNVKELYVIGSILGDGFNDISIAEYTDNYFILHDLFEDIFGRRIDLITDKSLNNPYFIESINHNKMLLYARSS